MPADVYDGERWLQVNNTYTYGIVHAKVYADDIRVPAMPSFLMESTYENEHSASDVQLRRQAYWSVLRRWVRSHLRLYARVVVLRWLGGLARLRWLARDGTFRRGLPRSSLVRSRSRSCRRRRVESFGGKGAG